jgi:hypothetical protein
VMYHDLYEKLGLGEVDLTSFTSPIFGFSGEPTVPLGKTILLVLAMVKQREVAEEGKPRDL